MKTAAKTLFFSFFVLVGCHSTTLPPSEIVRQVELADSGDVGKVPVESLMNFFDHHARLAVRIEALCAPKRATGEVEWMVSDEGKVCKAVASRDRVKYLESLEAMKRMNAQYGDQNAAARIDEVEGK
jgi:hypothetical protein